jgi:hypothetical protein
MLPVPHFKQKLLCNQKQIVHFKVAQASKLLNYDPMKFGRRMREVNR